jgi:predicted anti-sigma-YlaC factor YlaD
MLTCQQMTALITDYLEERMSFMDRARFQLHVGMCRNCRRYLRQMKLSVAVLGSMPPEPVPDDVMDSLLARFGDWGGRLMVSD